MKDTIYNFLDNQVGKGLRCVTKYGDRYFFKSFDCKHTIFSAIVKHDRTTIMLFKGEKLCQIVEGFFPVSENDSWKYIRDWVADRHNINKVGDILKYIDEKTFSEI
mgnify:CR=1 FL=1